MAQIIERIVRSKYPPRDTRVLWLDTKNNLLKTCTSNGWTKVLANTAINNLRNAGYLFAGIATIDTNPETPDAKMFYIANGKGTYTHFGGINVTEDDVIILYYDTTWHKVVTGIASHEKLTELDQKVADLEQEVNIFGIDNFITDGFITTNGKFSPNTAFRCTDYIGVKGAIRLATENLEYNNPYISVIAFYDGQKRFLSNISNVGSFTKYEVEIPENTVYIRVTSTNRITNPRVKLLLGRTLAELVMKASIKADASVITEKPNLHFYKTPINTSDIPIIQSYEQGLYDVYIDKNAIPDITAFALWCYNGSLCTQYKKLQGGWINLLWFKPFSEIENNKYVNFEIDGRVVGYVIFKDKTKFTDYSSGSRHEMILEVITNNVFHNGFIIPGSITAEKLAFELPGHDVSISLPDIIYAVVGDTLQLFYRGIVKAVNPYNYDILVICAKGNQYPRYFEFTPTLADVGSVPFKITIKDNNRNIMAEKSCTIKVVNIASSPSLAKKIACFGDSLTAPGIWVSETYRRLTSIGGTPSANSLTNIDFVGAKTKDGAGYFGVGGWSWREYTTEGRNAYRFEVSGVTSLSINTKYEHNGNTFTVMEVNVTGGSGNILCSVDSLTPAPLASGTLSKLSGNGDDSISFSSYSQDSANPLWDYQSNKMTFIPYANKYAGGNLDIVYTLLSWNGLLDGMTNFSTILSMVKTFADTLHAEFPNAKLKIMGLQVPSVNGGMGANYGATGTSYSDRYGMVVTVLNMNQAYQDFANQDDYKSFVEFVNISSQFDSEYNMPQAEATVNTRNSLTEQRGTNGVHPSDNGYMQIADVVYRNLMASL